MRAGRPAFIMGHSSRSAAACFTRYTTTTRARNNVSRDVSSDLEHTIASDGTRIREQTKPAMRSYLAASRNFASGNATPRQFLERSLELLEIWEPGIGAFVCTNLPDARAAADRATERWRAGRPLSPIDGMPIGIKDVIETFDMPTQMGSPLFLDWRLGKDAASLPPPRAAAPPTFAHTFTPPLSP